MRYYSIQHDIEPRGIQSCFGSATILTQRFFSKSDNTAFPDLRALICPIGHCFFAQSGIALLLNRTLALALTDGQRLYEMLLILLVPIVSCVMFYLSALLDLGLLKSTCSCIDLPPI